MTPAFLVSEGGGFNPLNPSEASNLLWTLVIFFAGLPLMWKFVFGPITRALDARDGRARAAVKEAEAARDEAKRAQAAVEERLAAVGAEAQKILGESRERAEVEARAMVDRAREEITRERDRATSDIEGSRAKALEEIRAEVVDLAIRAASEVVGRNFDAADQRTLARSVVEAAAGVPARG